jgi:hypothetical protein
MKQPFFTISQALLMHLQIEESKRLSYWFHKGKSLKQLAPIIVTLTLLERELILQQIFEKNSPVQEAF